MFRTLILFICVTLFSSLIAGEPDSILLEEQNDIYLPFMQSNEEHKLKNAIKLIGVQIIEDTEFQEEEKPQELYTPLLIKLSGIIYSFNDTWKVLINNKYYTSSKINDEFFIRNVDNDAGYVDIMYIPKVKIESRAGPGIEQVGKSLVFKLRPGQCFDQKSVSIKLSCRGKKEKNDYNEEKLY